MIRRLIQIAAIAALLPKVASGQTTVALSEPLPPEVIFAREFIRVLQDSGSAAVLPLTTPSTRALRGFAPNMDALRSELASTRASLALERWSIVAARDDIPELVLVVFKVHGPGAPSALSL